MFAFLRTARVWAICLWAVLAVVSGARAANYDVFDFGDSGAGTLRRALSSLSADGDTITFHPGSHGVAEFEPHSGLPEITVDTSFTGPHHGIFLRSLYPRTRTLFSAGDGVALSGLDTILTIYAEGDAPTVIQGMGTLTVSGAFPELISVEGISLAGGIKAVALNLDNGLSGQILTTSEVESFGVWGTAATTVNGDISGTIRTGADDNAYAVRGGTLTVQGNVSGEVLAEADKAAYALSADADLMISGDISGKVSASGTLGSAVVYGIFGGDNVTLAGGVSGTVSARGKYFASGIVSHGRIYIGNGILGSITANSTLDNPWDLTNYALSASDTLTVDGGIAGRVEVTSNQRSTALHSDETMIISGDISGTISATSTATNVSFFSEAAGLETSKDLYINNGISGTIGARAWNSAYGIRAGSLVLQEGVSGSITALSETSYGCGIRTDNNLVIKGGILGQVTARSNRGLHAHGIESTHGDISLSGGVLGTISSSAGTDYAYGVVAYNGIVTINGGISGTIAAQGGGHSVYGLYAKKNLDIFGGISGNIMAKTSTGSNAFGLQAVDNLTIAGDMSGKIEARAGSPGTGTKAYGVSAGGTLDIERISGTVTAASGTDFAYGLHSVAGLRIADGILGTISAQAGRHYAYGLYTDNDLDILGGISGNILARAGAAGATALYGDQVSVSGDIFGIVSARGSDTATALQALHTLRINNGISGTITATATQTVANAILAEHLHISSGVSGTVSGQAQAFAYGTLTSGGTIIQGGISGTVSGSATTNDGCGLYASSDITISKGISGIVSASAGTHNAYGLYSGGGTISISGGIAGRVETQAGGVNSFGLNGRNGVSVTGGISGTITASAGRHTALGLAASHGRINGGAPDTALDISGTVSARAQGLAVAVSSGEGMTIGVSGVLNGMDQTGGGAGYAIRSGRPDGAGGWVDTEAVDIVTLFNGANLGGKIDLSGGNDTLTFEGAAGTDSLISGGSGRDTLGLSGTGTARFSADITDFERLVKSGSGRWILPGNLDIPGTIVNGGTLEVQGNLVSSDTQIGPGGAVVVNGVLTCPRTTLNRGGTLGGGGSIRGNLVNLGTIAPGNSPGTLTIQGDYVHGPGSTLAMEITPATSDRLVVTGTADLQGGTMALAFAPGYYQAGARYPLLSAAGGINGAFSQVTDNSAFLDIGLSQDNDVLGGVVTRRPYEDAAASQNARQAGMVLTAAAADPSAAMQKIISVLDFLPAALVSQGLDQLHPEPFDALSQVTFSTMGMFAGTTRDRLFALRTGRAKQLSELNDNEISRLPLLAASGDLSAIGPLGLNRHGKGAATPFGLYIKPLGRFETYENSGNRTGYTARTFGVAAGGDMGICHKGILGLQLGYARSDLDFVNTSQARSDHFLASLYGSYFDQGFYADAVIQAGGASNTMERKISIGGLDQNAESGFTALDWGTGLKLGYDFPVNKKVRIGPVGSLDYAFVSNPLVMESGAPGLNLKINGNTAESLKSALGLIASAEFDLAGKMVLTPDLSVKWGHEFLNSSRLIGAVLEGWPNTGFTARTGNPSRDSMLVGAGLTLRVKDRSMVFARYTGELLAGDHQAHGAAAGFRYEF